MKIDLCGLDSCHDEEEDDDKSDPGLKHEAPVGGHRQLLVFMARKKEHSLYLQQRLKEIGTGSTEEVVHKEQCSWTDRYKVAQI